MLGLANSRMKDFFDLAVIALRKELDGATLAAAIAATFARRQTAQPTERPLALTKQFRAAPVASLPEQESHRSCEFG
ncbi:Nucleotidyl transferase AbiEii toxin, Type IV TA system [Paenacidovorax caeni]|uniref:Nucleotidyl transferase AbiEii toxin, Type IV TA system n=1 Tax=Paenacidovorax caeni TaxID=343013 RepID=A0A1I7KHZ5_9BURK|nr:Nucleotidyl transferase AbiEii toxin, Type IV TA system [Paenacidovorax caeni]